MQGALEVFEKTFWNGLNGAIRRDFKDRAEQQAAMNVDF
jgi:hypothetical protein